MDSHNFTHQGEGGYLTELRESHWLPALRPNADEHQLYDEKAVPEPPDLSQEQPPSVDTSSGALQNKHYWEQDSVADGEESRLDPAWGFQRTDSTNLLDRPVRSPTFPEPVSQSVAIPQDEVLPSSQVEDLVQTEEQETQQSAEVTPVEEATTDRTTDDTMAGASFGAVIDSRDPVPVLDEEETRFEEGLPLIPSEEVAHTETPNQQQPSDDPFASAALDEESSFFSQLKDEPEEENKSSPTLDRKDTSDVLGGMMLKNGETDSPPLYPDPETNFFDDQAKGANVTENADDLWAAALDDDEFLVEDADDLLPDSEPGSPSSFSALLQEEDATIDPGAAVQSSQDTAAQAARQSDQARRPQTLYAPHQPRTSELTSLAPKTYGNIGFTPPGLPPMGSLQSQIQQQDEASRAASFADKAKGGYQSPYDLPMDIAPKRRPQTQRPPAPVKTVAPPPRTSSMSSDKQLQPPFTPTGAVQPPFSPTSPIQETTSPVQRMPSATSQAPPPTTKATPSQFFEELPIAPRARHTPGPARYTPSQTHAVAPPPQIPVQTPAVPRQAPVQQPPMSAQPSPPKTQDPYSHFQLQPPERLDPYANVPLQAPSIPAPGPQSTRYSPAPPVAQNGIRPSPSPRYSPAPPPAGAPQAGRYASQPTQAAPPANVAMQFQPRTSSPLAHHRRSVDDQATGTTPAQPIVRPGPPPATVSASSANFYAPASIQSDGTGSSPSRATNYALPPAVAPPRRSMTQSPSQQAPKPSFPMQSTMTNARPASAFGQIAPLPTSSSVNAMSPPRPVRKSRDPIQDLEFIKPQDETQFDPLERWKGAPIFKFGFGGQTISCFPKHTPRYGAGSTRPQVKASSGDVLNKKLSDNVPLAPHVASFPGPLRGKSKKKDVLSWLASYISNLESGAIPPVADASQNLPDPRQRLEEKILLWKIIKVLVENDGVLDTAQAMQAVSAILMPEVHAIDESTATQYGNNDGLVGIYRPAGANVAAETTDPQVAESLRKHLLKGKREDAVWHAVDNRLWSHAMLIASTLDTAIWKQVVQEFVRQDVKTVGNNAESLCTLYQIFGGNLEDSIDQLVPPSARAGLQMVSKVDAGGPTKNALDGLNRWKETLTLVLNNRTMEDQRALATLARLLSDYGRIEAAHICYLFARNPAMPPIFGGADESQASIVLLGADHVRRPFDFFHDTDAVLLTETYEFAVSLPGNAALPPMPHLAVYKLQRANELADAGQKSEAQAYCDAIAAGLRSSTKQSLYYHPLILGEVEDLSNRLKQIPVQGSSWIGKPSIEKVSGSVWNKLNNFITGDESDDAKSARDPGEAGPFAGVSGSPGISRSGSQSDLYGGYSTSTPSAPMTTAGSRYAPNGLHSAKSSSELIRSRPSFEKSPPSTSHSSEMRSLYAPMLQHPSNSPLGMSPPVNNFTPPQHSYSPGVAPEMRHATPPQSGYVPYAAQEALQATPPQQQTSYEPYVPIVPAEQAIPAAVPAGVSLAPPSQPQFGGYSPPQGELETVTEETSPYEPVGPTYGSYAPPEDAGYQPYVPPPDSDDETDAKPKAKPTSFMDDDHDFPSTAKGAAQAPPSRATDGDATRKKANDEAADAAFRAAAEADAKRAKEQAAAKKSGSWLGGWFGGKKNDSLDPGAPKGGSDAKATQIKFGESKMKLYYDKDLKKWVNPDNPEASQPKATPPPPRSNAATPGMGGPPPTGGPPRSAPGPPMAQPTSRAGTPAGNEDIGGSHISATLPPTVNQSLGLGSSGTAGPPTGASSAPTPNPPSRPSSSMSGASGLDDLLGGPPTGARKGGAGRGAKAKKGRYVDVMAK